MTEKYTLTIHEAIYALLDGHTVENVTGVWVYQYRIKDDGWQYRRKHIDRRDSKYWEKTGVEEMWFTPDDLKARFRVVPKYKLEKWD